MDITRKTLGLQKALEQEMLDVSRLRFLAKSREAEAEGRADETSYGARLIAAAVPPMVEALRVLMEPVRRGRPGKAHEALGRIASLDLETIAYITLRTTVATLATNAPLVRLAQTIGTRIEDEVCLRAAAERDPNRVEFILNIALRGLSYEHRRRVASALLKSSGLREPLWSLRVRIEIGLCLLTALVESTGLFVFDGRAEFGDVNRRPTTVVRPTETTMRWIEGAREAHALVAPSYWPTIIPPRRWKRVFGGGYYSRLPRPLAIAKVRPGSAGLSALQSADLTDVMAAFNAAQRTPFRVNRWLLARVEEALALRRPVAGLPGLWDESEAPPRPADIDTNEEARREWRRAAAQFHSRRTEHYGRRLQLAGVLSQARRFSSYDRFYLPVQADFRGRLYYLPALSPQGPDVVRGLLEFADGKPINDEIAAGWLMVHLANCAGVDKTDFADRIAWVENNHARILQAADDPWADEWWADLDSPWQFLAAARDYAGLVREGYGYVSHTIVYVDGSCNGLQHLSALLRDPVGGAAVNLVPSDRPADIYQAVAERLVERLRVMAEGPEGDDRSWARRWLSFGLDRKIVKRVVMCLPYGIGKFSSRNYVIDAVRERLGEAPSPFRHVAEDGTEVEGLFSAAAWLTGPLWEAIGDVVVAAREVQAWFQTVARALVRARRPVSWVTPDGWPVVQSYPKGAFTRIDATLFGRRIQLRTALPESGNDAPDERAHVNGISPNIVHSLDATALRQYVLLAEANGMRHFALVHDSFGAHAADTRLMQTCLRESFVSLYQQDVLAGLAEQFSAAAPDIPPPPPRRGLDISVVRDSLFFCA